MSRVHYAFNPATAPQTAEASKGFRSRIPSRAVMRDRRFLRAAIEAIGLFLFGFGSTNLLMHSAVGLFIASRFATVLPYIVG